MHNWRKFRDREDDKKQSSEGKNNEIQHNKRKELTTTPNKSPLSSFACFTFSSAFANFAGGQVFTRKGENTSATTDLHEMNQFRIQDTVITLLQRHRTRDRGKLKRIADRHYATYIQVCTILNLLLKKITQSFTGHCCWCREQAITSRHVTSRLHRPHEFCGSRLETHLFRRLFPTVYSAREVTRVII